MNANNIQSILQLLVLAIQMTKNVALIDLFVCASENICHCDSD